MAYIRFKVQDELHKTIKEVCKKMGVKESELSRVALIGYLTEMGVFKQKIQVKK